MTLAEQEFILFEQCQDLRVPLYAEAAYWRTKPGSEQAVKVLQEILDKAAPADSGRYGPSL